MFPLRVIGIGSPFGDDQVGWQVVELLSSTLPNHYPVSLIRCETPTSDLLPLLQGAEKIILVDAVQAGMTIGAIGCWCTLAEIKAITTNLSSHALNLPTLLELASALGQLPRWMLYGVEIGEKAVELTPAITLSESVKQALPKLATQITAEIQQFLNM